MCASHVTEPRGVPVCPNSRSHSPSPDPRDAAHFSTTSLQIVGCKHCASLCLRFLAAASVLTLSRLLSAAPFLVTKKQASAES
mmetsp:Transcript_49607/g.116989  ORF Transcript_49607/g.116989 Transcript_49607/m.116989 type:complete len:83 (-) Transcript_49607:35-283(-)